MVTEEGANCIEKELTALCISGIPVRHLQIGFQDPINDMAVNIFG